MQFVISDEAWQVWEPLIEAVRPKGKTPPRDVRRTIAAIFWRHQNGSKWRSVPFELGPRWTAAQLFLRWTKLGIWETLFERLKDRDPSLGMVFLDCTNIRAHDKAAGAAKKGDSKAGEAIVKHLAVHVEASAARSVSP